MGIATRVLAAASIAAAAILAVPAAAGAQAVLPPGNSAVNQYTESFPTWRGNTPVSGRNQRPPGDVLGGAAAGRLEGLGEEGREAAAALAATVPAADLPRSGGPAGADGGGERGASSGVGEVISQATGASADGAWAVLLPLLIILTLVASLAHLLRQWRRLAS